jgi:acyl carrier protein
MPESERIYADLNDLFRETFPRESKPLTAALVATDVAGWDSVSHLAFILSIEERFRIEFTNSELSRTTSMGVLLEMIRDKLTAAGDGRN